MLPSLGVNRKRDFMPQDAYLLRFCHLRRSVEQKIFERPSPVDGVLIAGFEATETPEDFTRNEVSRLVPNTF